MQIVTLDIETEGEFHGNGDISNQEVTIACIHDSQTGGLLSFTREELPQLWPILERADIVVGYNCDHFDIPVLNKYYAGDLTKIRTVDLLKEVRNVLGRRLKLDNLAEATLGRGKAGSGLQAREWWARGEVEKVREYCLEDVRITRELYDYVKKHKSLKYKDYDGLREIKLDPSGWEIAMVSPALTHTLPF